METELTSIDYNKGRLKHVLLAFFGGIRPEVKTSSEITQTLRGMQEKIFAHQKRDKNIPHILNIPVEYKTKGGDRERTWDVWVETTENDLRITWGAIKLTLTDEGVYLEQKDNQLESGLRKIDRWEFIDIWPVQIMLNYISSSKEFENACENLTLFEEKVNELQPLLNALIQKLPDFAENAVVKNSDLTTNTVLNNQYNEWRGRHDLTYTPKTAVFVTFWDKSEGEGMPPRVGNFMIDIVTTNEVSEVFLVWSQDDIHPLAITIQRKNMAITSLGAPRLEENQMKQLLEEIELLIPIINFLSKTKPRSSYNYSDLINHSATNHTSS